MGAALIAAGLLPLTSVDSRADPGAEIVSVPRTPHSAGQVRVSGGITTYSTTTTLDDDGTLLAHFFVLGDVSLTWSITEYWELSASIRGGGALAGDQPEGIVHAILDCRYVIDALTWVPWLTMGVGALYRTRGTAAYLGDESAAGALDMTAHAGLGVDYRPESNWSIGAVVRYNFAITDDISRVVGPIELSLSASYYF